MSGCISVLPLQVKGSWGYLLYEGACRDGLPGAAPEACDGAMHTLQSCKLSAQDIE